MGTGLVRAGGQGVERKGGKQVEAFPRQRWPSLRSLFISRHVIQNHFKPCHFALLHRLHDTDGHARTSQIMSLHSCFLSSFRFVSMPFHVTSCHAIQTIPRQTETDRTPLHLPEKVSESLPLPNERLKQFSPSPKRETTHPPPEGKRDRIPTPLPQERQQERERERKPASTLSGLLRSWSSRFSKDQPSNAKKPQLERRSEAVQCAPRANQEDTHVGSCCGGPETPLS